MSAQPPGPIDPEEAMQERGDWFGTLVLAVFTYAPVIMHGLIQLLVYGLAIGIVIHHFTR